MKGFRLFKVLCLWLYIFNIASSCIECDESVVLRAVRGLDAVLPCGQGRVFLDGPDSHVIWMKNGHEFIYRYPNEGTRSLATDALEHVLEEPCGEDSCPEPTSLQLKRVGEQDGGIYRCRVHYQASPAVDYVIELRIVDSPGTPKIFADGYDLSGYVEQLSLGSNITLVCEVKDEQPGTLLWWERNGVEMARAETVHDGVLQTTVKVTNATRDELDAHYECLAQNADVTDPLSASVIVKMQLPPMSVEIRLNNNLDFEAGQPRVVDCVVVGCVPPPTIIWHLGNVMLRPNAHKELHDGNFTVSSLTLAPSMRDDKQELSCRAYNSHLPRVVFEAKVAISVGFRPTCLNEQEEVVGYMEGQTEGVTCTVESYPEPMQFSWTFADTKTLYTSVKKVPGYHNWYSSSLTWKPQEKDLGELLCRATNALGEQKRPCVYNIVAGGPPMTPDCEPITTYPDVIKIGCKKSWDGGRPQTLHLELLNLHGRFLTNVTEDNGFFALPPTQERNVTAVIYASNSRGRSDAKIINLVPMESTIPTNSSHPKWQQPKGAWMEAAVGTLVFVTLLGVLARSMLMVERRCVPIDEPDEQEEEHTVTIRSDGSFHREPEFQLSQDGSAQPQHVAIRVPSCENQYALTVIPGYRKPPCVGCRDVPPPLARENFPELVQDERISYFV